MKVTILLCTYLGAPAAYNLGAFSPRCSCVASQYRAPVCMQQEGKDFPGKDKAGTDLASNDFSSPPPFEKMTSGQLEPAKLTYNKPKELAIMAASFAALGALGYIFDK
mmetsp:Transcript_30458/g.50447  ORF Transcript_30458/g.50447 Transcript_30458/m.50447 type:complete len:108 (+) Transcript_30458:52-375(+)